MYKDEGMVSVDSPEAGAPHKKEHPHGGHVDDAHKMVIHQLTNAHQNACELLEHFSKCSTPHLEEEWVKKKDHPGNRLSRFCPRLRYEQSR